MTTMNIDQAKKVLKEIEQEQENGKTSHTKIEKFLFEFIELVNDEFSQANTNLFTGLVTQHLQIGHPKAPEPYKDIMYWVKIYISIMENPSIYENKGATII